MSQKRKANAPITLGNMRIGNFLNKRNKVAIVQARRPSRKAFSHNTKYKSLGFEKPMVNRGMAVMPNRYRTRMVYKQPVTFTIGASGTITQAFKGNSVVNPGPTGDDVGGANEMDNFYVKSKVLGSRITVTALGGAAHYASIVVNPRVDGSAITDAADIQAFSNQVNVDVPPGNVDPLTVSMYASTKNIAAIGSIDRDYAGSMTADPSALWYWHVYVLGTNGEAITCRVTVEYYIEFYDVKPLTVS